MREPSLEKSGPGDALGEAGACCSQLYGKGGGRANASLHRNPVIGPYRSAERISRRAVIQAAVPGAISSTWPVASTVCSTAWSPAAMARAR